MCRYRIQLLRLYACHGASAIIGHANVSQITIHRATLMTVMVTLAHRQEACNPMPWLYIVKTAVVSPCDWTGTRETMLANKKETLADTTWGTGTECQVKELTAPSPLPDGSHMYAATYECLLPLNLYRCSVDVLAQESYSNGHTILTT